MSRLVRAGAVLVVLGASLAVLWTVAFGPVVASTEAYCPDAPRDYGVASVDPATATVWVTDGCNRHLVARPVLAGVAAAAVGVVVEGAGLAARAPGGGG